MRKADRIGNASNYELAAKSLRRYVESMDNETRKEFGLPPHPNAMLCKLNIFTNGQCEPHINRDIIATQEGVDFVTKIMESWQYYIQHARR